MPDSSKSSAAAVAVVIVLGVLVVGLAAFAGLGVVAWFLLQG